MKCRQIAFAVSAMVLLVCGVGAQQLPTVIWERIAHSPLAGGTPGGQSVKYSSDGRFVYSGGERIYLNGGGESGFAHIKKFAAADGTELAVTPDYFGLYGISELALSPDGTRVVTANYEVVCDVWYTNCRGGYVQYDASQLARLAIPTEGNARESSVDYAPDGATFALGGQWYIVGPENYYNIRIVNAADLSIITELPGHLRAPNDGGTYSVRYSPDGQMLASGGADTFVKLWRIADGTLIRQMLFRSDIYPGVTSVAFSPDGNFIAAANAGFNAQIKVWRVSDGALIRTFNASPDYVNSSEVTWTRDGRHIVAGVRVQNLPSKILFWNFETFKLVQEYGVPSNRPIYSIDFAPNNKTFAFGTGTRVYVAVNPVSKATATDTNSAADNQADAIVIEQD